MESALTSFSEMLGTVCAEPVLTTIAETVPSLNPAFAMQTHLQSSPGAACAARRVTAHAHGSGV